MTQDLKAREEIWRRQQQFLIHSFLYYKLDESIVSDHHYDWLCKRLVELTESFSEEARELPYYDICRGVGANGSGYYIKEYPGSIRTTALRLLWQHKKRTTENFNEDFPHFISRWGFKLER